MATVSIVTPIRCIKKNNTVGLPDARQLQVPELQVSMRFEEVEDTDHAADLFGTILRSVRAARARREKE
jgi:hypothetical protein